MSERKKTVCVKIQYYPEDFMHGRVDAGEFFKKLLNEMEEISDEEGLSITASLGCGRSSRKRRKR